MQNSFPNQRNRSPTPVLHSKDPFEPNYSIYVLILFIFIIILIILFKFTANDDESLNDQEEDAYKNKRNEHFFFSFFKSRLFIYGFSILLGVLISCIFVNSLIFFFSTKEKIQRRAFSIVQEMIQRSTQKTTFAPSEFSSNNFNKRNWSKIETYIEMNPSVCVINTKKGKSWKIIT